MTVTKGMVEVPGGTFTMGSVDFYPEEQPLRRTAIATDPPPGKDTASAAPPATSASALHHPVRDRRNARQRNRCRRTARPGVSQYADSWTPSTTQNRRSTYLATAPDI